MGVIAKDKRKITIYYHSGTAIGEQTLAYVNVSEKKLHAVDIAKTNVTGTQWTELADGLGMEIHDLIDTSHPDFKKQFGTNTPKMLQHDWLKILEHEPQLLKCPIVIDGNDYLWIKSTAEFKEYLGPDSAGLEKKPLGKQFTDEDTP